MIFFVAEYITEFYVSLNFLHISFCCPLRNIPRQTADKMMNIQRAPTPMKKEIGSSVSDRPDSTLCKIIPAKATRNVIPDIFRNTFNLLKRFSANVGSV